jgi:zinc protease
MARAGGFILLAILCAALCACTGLPKAGIGAYGNLGAPSSPVPFMEQVRTGTLPGGLRYYILENAMPEKRAYLTLAVNAGSVLEDDDEQGLAHFVEHMAFNGTTRFPESELINYLRSLGMRFGPEVNAYTTFDETVYGIEVPVETGTDGVRRIPDTALAVLDDWTHAITFAPDDVDDERAVIMEEYRARLGAMERLRRQLLPVLFRGSPYAVRNPIGKPEIIEGSPASKLEGFYRKWYQADNMALILVGDFDAASLEASLNDHFSIPKPAAPVQRPAYDLPRPKKGAIETLILTDPEMTSTQINLFYKRSREAPRNDLSYFRNEIIDILIDRMLGFRFEDEVMKPETPYTYAGAGNVHYGASSRFYLVEAQAKTGLAEDCIAELLKTKASMLRHGFTAEELAMAADSLLSDMRRMVSEKDKRESSQYIYSLTQYYLRGGNHAGLEWELAALEQLLPRITTADIAAAITGYFNPGDVLVSITAPEAERESLPTEARIRQMLKTKITVPPPKIEAVESEFLSHPPEPGQIVSETIDKDTGALVWELGNGAKVLLKETKNRNNEIILHAMARGGFTSVPVEDQVSASLAAEMVQVSGLGTFSRTELARKLANKQVSAAFWTGAYYRGIQGFATSGDLKTLFEMVYLGFTEPKIDAKAAAAMKEQYRTSLARRDENPETVFSDEINKTVYSGNPYFKPLELADISRINNESALAFIRRSLNPGDYTFIFTGNLDIETMRSYIAAYIASIPRTESWNEWTNLHIARPGKTEKKLHKGKEERSLVYMGWFSKAPYTEETSAAVQVLSEYLDIQMTGEIREKLGGVYSISVGVSANPVPEGELSLSVYFVCDPRRADELSAAVIALLNRTAQEAITQDVFVKSIEALKKEWEANIQSNSYLAQSYANSAVLLRLPLSRLDKRPQYYSAVTPADIQKLCARLLQNGPARVVLLPAQ